MKIIAITGASSGIGEATARLLAGRGMKVVLAARRVDRIEALAAELGGDAIATDVTRRADVQALVDRTVERHGRLDALFSNAGVAMVAPLDEQTADDWDEMIDVNLRGFLHGIAAALPVFRRQQAGHFITTVSTSGLRIVPTQVVYAGTKNAVRTICEGLRQEAGPHLRVTAISPGYVRTELVDKNLARMPAAQAAQMRENMERLAISPDAIARAVLYAMEQPADVDVGEIVIRPTAQS